MVARQDKCSAGRGVRASRFQHVLVLILGIPFSAFADGADASPKFSKPTQDVIDLCTWASADRTSIAHEFFERGWTRFQAPYPEALPALLADGSLFHALLDERRNTFGLDTDTGVIPNMNEHLNKMFEVSQRGIYDAFWREEEPQAFLMLYDASDAPEHEIGCRYFSSSKDDATKIKDIIWDFDEETHESQYGPARIVTEYTSGHPPHRPLTGAAGLLVKFGLLVDRPLLEPQLGAGEATIQFFRYDVSLFDADFGREPNAAFALETRRRTGLDK